MTNTDQEPVPISWDGDSDAGTDAHNMRVPTTGEDGQIPVKAKVENETNNAIELRPGQNDSNLPPAA